MPAGLKSQVLGEVEWTLRNADGSVADRGRAENLYTRTGRRNMLTTFIGNTSGAVLALPTYVFIHNSEHPAGVKQGLRCLKVDELTPTPVQLITPVVAGYTRTFTGSFASPSAQRTIRGMGFSGTGTVFPGYTTEGGIRGVSAYLKFTTPVVQETFQTFEFVYKQTVVPNLAKGLRRFNPWTPLSEALRTSLLVNGTMPGIDTYSLLRATWGSYYFVDGGLEHRGVQPTTQFNSNDTGGCWARIGTTLSQPSRVARAGSRSMLTTQAYNDYCQGPVGMFGCAHSTSGDARIVPEALVVDHTRGAAWHALASHEGTLTPIYKHPVGETYAWNVVGSIALSQGSVEIRGPYIPDEHKSPWHWLHYVVIDDSGDTDGGTEGTYHIRRLGWGGYPYPTFYGNADTTWDAAEMIAAYFADNMATTGFNSLTHQIAFDGEFYWLAHYATGLNARLSRWRAGSNEQYWLNSIGDTTRWQPFTAPDANSLAYGVASDGAGSTWLLAPSSVLASQKLYKIDNTKPGRHYQRPSGAVLTANPATFTVDAADEIHAMFPFVVGDVGRKIRTVGTVSNGADTTRTITAFNNANSVNVDGAAFVTEVGMTWHWETATTMATNAWLASCGSTLLYAPTNTRLWTHSANGLHYSNDGGATWGTVDETTGLSTALAKTVLAQDGDSSSRTFLVGAAGVLYWIDTNNAVNKYVPGAGGPSGTHTRITNAALPAAPGGYTKGTLVSLIHDPCAPDIAGDSAGALWLGQDLVAGRCFWRLPCGAFAGGASYGETAAPISGTTGTYTHSSFQMGFTTPDGQTYMRSRAYASQWKRAYFNEATGTLSWANAGDIWFGITGSGSGDIHMRDNGLVFARSTSDLTTISDTYKDYHGGMVGSPVTYRYDDVAAIWRPWYGSAAQFNSRYGTTNGGKRKCHSTWQSVLKGQQPGNIELRFMQAGGAVAPADEFVAGESFTFGAAFGVSRTNTQDMTWTIEQSFADMEQLVEQEAIKTVVGPGALKCYHWRVATSAGETAKPLGVAAYPTNIPELTSGGVNYGWKPARATWLYPTYGGGSLPDTSLVAFGATTFSQMLIGLDLGAGPPAISRLHTTVYGTSWYYLLQNYHRASADRGRMKVYYSDDNAAWTEVPEVMFQLNGASPPAAGYANVYIEHNPQAGFNPNDTGGYVHVTFDLEGAGLGVGARTHRYWQIHIGSNDTTNTSLPIFGSVYATDGADIPIGLTSASRVDEAHDSDFGLSEITAVDFIQTRTGLSGQGGVNTVDDGDADGRTNIVTIASGTFDTGVISTVTDYLAWKESTGVGSGYIRRRYGASGAPGPWTTGRQARSRIIAVTSTQITVADDIIPDSLAAVDFEIRRPATGTVLSAGSLPWQDAQTGYFQFDNADIGREFRVTRKGVIRLP